MKRFLSLIAAGALAVGVQGGACASTIDVIQANQWYPFDIDDTFAASGTVDWIDLFTGDGLSFTLTLGQSAFLRVVDAGYAGDRFNVFIDNGVSVLNLQTGGALDSYPDAGGDYDLAWTDPRFSRLEVLLAPGSYTLTGDLLQAAGSGAPLNVTTGALQIAAVPEPATGALMLAALAIGLGRRRPS